MRAPLWNSSTVMSVTRLAEQVTDFRLGETADGVIVPLCRAEDGVSRRSWALSEVSIATRRAAGVPDPDDALAKLVATAKASWPEWEREQQPLLLLEPNGEVWRGATRRTDGQVIAVLYDRWLSLLQAS